MNKTLLLAAVAFFSSQASAKSFVKDIALGANNFTFSADGENKVDQFGKNVVEFTNPTIDGLAISITGTDVVEIKKQLCSKLGFQTADGFGSAYQPHKFTFGLGQNGELKGHFENVTTTDMFRCLGSI